MEDQIFLTGATGFLGMELMRRILLGQETARLFLLVRSTSKHSASERVSKALNDVLGSEDRKRVQHRVEIVEGDISLDKLGIKDKRYEELASRVDHVIHCAATVRFDLLLDEARRINTQGTKNVIDFALRAEKLGCLQRLDYIGTAYVAGRRRGVIKEDELDCGQKFSNSYERTKMEAEALVREYSGQLPTTIFRPSIIVGDSQTGTTTSFQGFYQPLKLYMRKLVLVIPADKNTPIDLVPVDYVADAIFYLMQKRESVGKCYHLTAGPDKTSTLGELTQKAYEFFKVPVPRFITLKKYNLFVKPILRLFLWGKKRTAMLKGELYLPYLSSHLIFDKTNALADLKGTGIEAPRPEDYFMKILSFYKERGRLT